METNYQIINDGVLLYFDKAFDADGKLKKNLFNWYCKAFEYTRCEYNKSLNIFKVFYKDANAKPTLNGVVIRYFTSGDGIDLHINLTGSLVSVSEKFIGSEFLCNFTGLTQKVHEEFFKLNPVRSITESVQIDKQIKSIVDYGRIDTKHQIESILQEWHDPRNLGGAVK